MNRTPTVVLFLVCLLRLAAPAFAAEGGGFTACGLDGQYYANPNFTGPAAFERQDNRLNFDWGTQIPVGGSRTPAFQNFPHDNFSARWSGAIVPRFSEKYVLTVESDAGAKVWLNKALVIDGSKSGAATSAPIALAAGNSYPIRVDYNHATGPAKLVLRWSSSSTPEEVIDPLSVNGFNLTNCSNVLFADEVKYSTVDDNGKDELYFWYESQGDNKWKGIPQTALDANLWPKSDAAIQLDPQFTGLTYKLRFSGKADVSSHQRWFGGQATFTSNGQNLGQTLTSGTGYDPATNTTTALVNMAAKPNGGSPRCWLYFANTQRDAAAPLHSGITNLQIMRPSAQTANAAPCDLGTIVYPGIKAALKNYVVYRYFGDAFADERSWGERTLPGVPSFSGSPPRRNNWANKPNWEYLVMLANEMGKDLYISIASTTDRDYYTKLAQLIKFGSDGVNPYTSYQQWPTSGPVYPPLNPNLRFYIEYSNEVWNFGFPQFGVINQASKDAVTNNTPDGQIINYDGQGAGEWRRWQALQTVHISDAFRAVFGDAAMGDRIRILLFDQYGFYGNQLGQFLDNYFNKTDPKSTYTGAAHPVSYYVWGGGGAIYYGSNHSTGIDPDIALANGSFETPALNDGASQTTPDGATWTFTGNAGICHNISRVPAFAGGTPGTPAKPAQGLWVGFKFTVGDKPIYVYDIGRLTSKDNSGRHELNIFKTDGSSILTNRIDTKGTDANDYAWTRVVEQGWTRNPEVPLKLDAGATYYAMSQEEGDTYATVTGATSPPGITIAGSATAPEGGGNRTFTDGTPGTLGPVNFRFTDTPEGDLGFICDAADGTQSAFVGDTGSMGQTVNFTKTGNFALGFNAAVKPNAANPVDVLVDGVRCTPLGGDGPLWQVSDSAWQPGGFERRADDLAIWWGSAPFAITKTGPHIIKGTGKTGDYMFFDNVKLLSEDGIYGKDQGYFPSMGEANGQDPRGGLDAYVNTLHGEINWTAAWGMKTMAYEGGWSLGGDFDQKPIHSYCKYVSSQTISADAKAIDVYTHGGGSLFCYYYSQWPSGDDDNAVNYPLVQAVMKRNDRLPAEPDYGTLVPANLQPANISITSSTGADSAGNLTAQGAWSCWNVIAPQTRSYRISADLETTASGGGAYAVLVDDRINVLTGAAGTALTATAFLTKGQHTLKVRSTGTSPLLVKTLSVSMEGSPPAPSLLGAAFANAVCKLNWSAAPGAAGYIVYYGTTSGNYTSSLRTGQVTGTAVPGLDNDGVYYFSVQAVGPAEQLSFNSNELRVAQRSTDPELLVDFHELSETDEKFGTVATDGFTFTAFGNSSQFHVFGPKSQASWNRWPSPTLYTDSWGCNHRIERTDFRPFDLYSLEIYTPYKGMSAVITGYDPSGASFKHMVNFPDQGDQIVVPVTLDWVHVAKVEVRWYDKPDAAGGGSRNGGIANLRFNHQAGG